MARLVNIGGRVFEETGARLVNVGGRVFEETVSGAVTASGTPSISALTSSASATLTRHATSTASLSEIVGLGAATRTPATNVVITDVNTTESWTDGDSNLIITGTGFV